MAQSLSLKIKGLFTSFNDLSEVPPGALTKAKNIVIDQDSIAEPRRGFDIVAGGFTDVDDRAAKIWYYQDKLMAHHGTPGTENTISYHDAAVWTANGTFSAPTDYKMRTLEGNQNLYCTTNAGIQKLDAYNATPKLAGAYKALDLSAGISASASTWLPNDYRTAYRGVWGYKDANDNLILGAPSQREAITNTAGSTKAIDIRATIPSGATTSWFFQLYRAESKDNSGSVIEPSDEMGLVYEVNPNSTDITNGYIDITDIVPDSLRGATLYTAASQEGLAYGNERPPLAKDMNVFRDCFFFANTTSKHRYYLTLLAADGSNGLAADNTLVIGGVTYTAKATEDIASAHFDRVTSGSAAQNITDTALSLVRVINRHASSTVYAYYLSGPDDLPGKILLEERGIGGASFAVTSSAVTTTWSPSLPSSGTTESSTNDRFKNGLAWSKPNQPESVPLVNFVQVGDKDKEVLRVVPLREALYIFKEDEGIYKCSGYYPNFQIELLDSSAKLVGSETCAILNNQIFCLTDQGVTVVSDSTKVVSRPIETDILSLFGNSLALIREISFGLAYETDRKYYLFLPTESSDTYPTQAYVFNTFTNTWVRHVLTKTCGTIHNNRLYLADAISHYVNEERKNYSYLDYVDFGFNTSITNIAARVITLDAGTDNIVPGDILYQSSVSFAVITDIDPITSTVTIASDPGLVVDTCSILKAIDCEIEWVPVTAGNPGITKQFHTVLLLFKRDFAGTGYLGFSSELSQDEEEVPIYGSGGSSGWGLFLWGTAPWGGIIPKKPSRQWVPREKQRCSQLTIRLEHTYGYSPWQLQGLTVFGEMGSEKVVK